jgi:hypothetical protein
MNSNISNISNLANSHIEIVKCEYYDTIRGSTQTGQVQKCKIERITFLKNAQNNKIVNVAGSV